jgi:hypothetical protein
MKSFHKQKAVFLCLALSLGQGLFAQDLNEVKRRPVDDFSWKQEGRSRR